MNKDKFAEISKKEYKCLDKGFVRLIDVMGDDSAIVQSARVSYGKGAKSVREDRALIRYLMRNRHTSPFEMAEMKFHVKLPIFVARQWIRHRTANVNEYSGRYSEMPNEFFIPEIEQIRPQSQSNKQGRGGEPLEAEQGENVREKMKALQSVLFNEYEDMLERGVAREISRVNLPLSVYTQWYWKIDLHNLFHFLKLRLDEHAQYEIRVYAEIIANMVKKLFPLSWEAFEDYVLNATSFSATEMKILKNMLDFSKGKTNVENFDLSKTETAEFAAKIKKISNIK